MKKNFVAICAVIASMFTANAQEQAGTNATATDGKAEIPEAVELLQAAGQLVKYGYASESALPLIQAIEIYQTYASPSSDNTKTTTTNEQTGTPGEKNGNMSYDVSKLIADATTFADGDEHYLALLDNVKTSATRGATRNYAAHHDRVNAYSTDTYTIRFRGNERACVIVSGDGDTDLDLYIYDANGNLVASDTDYSDDCVCIWTPAWTGSFKIKIVNRGSVYNAYVMAVN